LQPEILAWIQASVDPSGIPVFVNFFTFNLHECEYPSNKYDVTRAYLKFIEAVFSKTYPEQFLSIDQRVNLQDSLLSKFLQHIYHSLLANFLQLTFSDMKDFLKLYTLLLKLTNDLLSNFKDITYGMKKAPLQHRYPHYDELLRVYTEVLNGAQNLDYLLINALMLQEDVIRG
jgi:hypothetical protein